MSYPEKIKGDMLKELILLMRDSVNAVANKKDFLDHVKSAFELSESEQKKAEEGKIYIAQSDTLRQEIKSRESDAQQKILTSLKNLTEANNVRMDNESTRIRHEKMKVELEKRENAVSIIEKQHKTERAELDSIKTSHDERARKLGEKEKELLAKEIALNDRAEKIKQAVG